MRFLDSSIIVSAVLKPRRTLTAEERVLKAKAAGILREVDAGVEVATTVVHLNEVANVLSKVSEGGMPVSHAAVKRLMTHPHVKVLDVSRDLYFAAVGLAEQFRVDVADALGGIVMREVLKTNEIYTLNRKHYAALDPQAVILP